MAAPGPPAGAGRLDHQDPHRHRGQRRLPARQGPAGPGGRGAVDGTRFGYKTGWRIRRDQLLTTLLLVSANDAAETLAAAWPDGGQAGFLQAMQAKAVELGCTDSTWRDPSGLDVPGHQAGAADLAVLGQALLERPVLAKLVGSRVAPYAWPGGRKTVLGNHNHFVGLGRGRGALGIKTGYDQGRLDHRGRPAARRPPW